MRPKVLAFLFLAVSDACFLLIAWPLHLLASVWLAIQLSSDPEADSFMPSLQAIPTMIGEQLHSFLWMAALLLQALLFACFALRDVSSDSAAGRPLWRQAFRWSLVILLLSGLYAVIFFLLSPAPQPRGYWWSVGELLICLLLLSFPLMVVLAAITRFILASSGRQPAAETEVL